MTLPKRMSPKKMLNVDHPKEYPLPAEAQNYCGKCGGVVKPEDLSNMRHRGHDLEVHGIYEITIDAKENLLEGWWIKGKVEKS